MKPTHLEELYGSSEGKEKRWQPSKVAYSLLTYHIAHFHIQPNLPYTTSGNFPFSREILHLTPSSFGKILRYHIHQENSPSELQPSAKAPSQFKRAENITQ